MRVILAGQKSFGEAVLQMLLAQRHDVAAVWSPWKDGEEDKLTRRARMMDLWHHPVERTCKNVEWLEADLFVAAHSHDFIGRDSRAATRLGGIGYHPSLLPRHRGRDAVRWTVHMRDPITGGSVYWLTDSVDGGPIAAQDWCHAAPGETASALWRGQLFDMGIRLLRDVLCDLDRGIIVEIPQQENVATWEPSWSRPPLFRPELPQIGAINGFKHVTSKEALHGSS